MKNLKITQALFIAIICLFGFTACEKEEENIQMQTTSQKEIIEILPISVEMQKKFDALELENVTYERNHIGEDIHLDFYVYDDMFFFEEQVNEMYNLKVNNVKQWHSTNLVTGLPRVIQVKGTTLGPTALSIRMRGGLNRAVANFNALGLGLTFNLIWGLPAPGDDIIVRRIINPIAGSRSGYPAGGNPFRLVNFFSGMDALGLPADHYEHEMTHAIGHCVGLRHTDWATNSSCGVFAPEAVLPIGAIYIPGTAPGSDPNSVMQACRPAGTNGEFSLNDIIALTTLY